MRTFCDRTLSIDAPTNGGGANADEQISRIVPFHPIHPALWKPENDIDDNDAN